MSKNNEIATLTQNFANQLAEIVERQARERAIQAIGGTNGTATKQVANGSGRRSRADMERLRETIWRFAVSAKRPIKASEIAEKVGVTDSQQLSFPLRQLVLGKLLIQKGERAKTTYTASTRAIKLAKTKAEPAREAA